MPFSDFRLMAVALWLVALCSLAVTLRTFGFWRWLKYQYADARAYLFDAEEDDCDLVWDDAGWTETPEGWVEKTWPDEPPADARPLGKAVPPKVNEVQCTPRPADAPKKRKRRPKRDA
jgi:hypothetical protein